MTVENTRKLTFRSFDEDTFKEKNAKAEYEVMMNPANIIRTLSTKKDKTKPRGAVGSDGKWMGLESETYKFDLIFDGTGLVKENADVEEEIEIMIKYEGYISRQMEQVEKMNRLEQKKMPADIVYADIDTLSAEARQKLDEIRPLSLGQASRISGVSPADITALLIVLEQHSREEKNHVSQ